MTPRPRPPKRPRARPPRETVILLFPQSQMLDVAGPADVFAMASQVNPELPYRVRCVSPTGGPIAMSNGLHVDSVGIDRYDPASAHTLLVAGAERSGLVPALEDERLREWACKAATRVERLVSVCVGAFALAEWGLLDGKRATTHWSVTHLLETRYPRVAVDHAAIYVRDGSTWTAGGVTTGIDMSLAMVEADSSRLVAGQVAKALVMSSRRVGNQAQYSTELLAQSGRYAALIEWMTSNLESPMGIAALADRAGESQRSFCRRFSESTRQTPAAFVETLRMQSAMRRLQGGSPLKTAARGAGFSSVEQLGKVFKRRLGMSPGEYRQMHGLPETG